MFKKELKKELEKLLNEVPIENLPSKLKLSKTYRPLYDQLVKCTSFLDPYNPKTTERLYCFMNNIKERPVCPMCGKPVKFESYTYGYRKFCSAKCAAKDPEWKKKHEETNLKKYGAKWGLSKKSSIRKKIDNAVKEKYGVDNVRKLDFIKEKAKKTIKKKYGVDNVMRVDEIKEKVVKKAKETIKKKYGVDNIAQHSKIRKKISRAHRSEETKQKIRETLKERYGGDYVNVSQIPKVQEKIRQSMIEKYGGWIHQEHYKNLDKLNDLEFVKSRFVKGDDTDVVALANFFGMSRVAAYRYIKRNGLPLNLEAHTSRFEQDIISFIRNELGYHGEIRKNVRGLLKNKNLEADIYLPEFNLIIEADGVHWHSIGTYPFDNTSNYLYEKTRLKNKVDLAHEAGFKFLNIRDSEWYDNTKGEIWKSMIRVKLGLAERIHARDCSIENLSWKDASRFLLENHLQGTVVGTYLHLALVYGNEVVAIMTFGKSRSKKYQNYTELYRFAVKKNFVVIGGASKLLKHARSNYSLGRLLSYANRRWSNGNLYERLGFKLRGVTKPGYVYVAVNSYKTISRVSAQKHKLASVLDDYDPTLSETENMWRNKWRILFDAGNYIFTT